MTPLVLCLHSFSSNARQFRSLAARLSPRFTVVAPDFYGHGATPTWEMPHAFTLADELTALQCALPEGVPVHLVGHSYGGAVAMRFAAEHPERVRSLTLYEPTVWGTLSALRPEAPGTREIEAVRDDTNRLVAAGALEAAAERFIDYWAGTGAWAATPPERRPKLVATMPSLPAAWRVTFEERWRAETLRALDMPCLLLTGSRSTAAAHLGVRLLVESLPRAELVELAGLGHLGPVVRPERVDAAIEAFLLENSFPATGAASAAVQRRAA